MGGSQAHVLRMSPAEEYANAASMLCPLATSLVFVMIHGDVVSLSVWLSIIGQVVHLPFSMLYHIQCARLGKAIHPVDNIYRVGDQVFIMVASVFLAVALSGVVWYAVGVGILVIIYIAWLLEDFHHVSKGLPVYPSRGAAPGRRHSI